MTLRETCSSLKIALLVLIAGCAVAPTTQNPVLRWSARNTWQGKLPIAGAKVSIAAGQTVLLDVSPPALDTLEVRGRLVFAERDLELRAKTIRVSGELSIGSPELPFQHNAQITLSGSKRDVSTDVKSLLVTGRLELHGANRGQSWLHLSRTATAGDTTLTLERNPEWHVGDELVIASTDFDPQQAETLRVKSVNANTVSLERPLEFTHWGSVVNGVDERAEVGLLSKNIVVQGDATSSNDGFGGQVMMMAGAEARLEGVEFRDLGRRGEIGRYPVHFHLLGDGNASFVRDSSLHHNFNRCLTLHGTNNVRVEDNVAFDTLGHCLFLEDGLETGNVFKRNLVLMTRRPAVEDAILKSDLRPASYWIANPNNIFEGNVAAGSEEHGFWFALPLHPTGASASPENDERIWPRRTPLGWFAGNTAHSNGHSGLYVDDDPNPAGVYDAPSFEPQITPAGAQPRAVQAVFADFTGYKNRRRGVWMRGSHLVLSDAKLADNAIGVTLASSQSVVRDSLIVGETDNIGTPGIGASRSLPKPLEPHFPIRGFEFYDGLINIENTRFVNFQPSALRQASALSAMRFTPFFIDPRNYTRNLRFENAQAVYFENRTEPKDSDLSSDGYRSAVFVDHDGSLTGNANRAVVVSNPLLVNEACIPREDWNAFVCDNLYARLFIDNRDPPEARAEVGPVSLERVGATGTHRMWGNPQDGPNTSFQSNLILGQAYKLSFAQSAPAHLRLSLRHNVAGSWIEVQLNTSSAEVFVYSNSSLDHTLHPVATLQVLRSGATGYALQNRLLTVRLRVEPGKASANLEICARRLCR